MLVYLHNDGQTEYSIKINIDFTFECMTAFVDMRLLLYL